LRIVLWGTYDTGKPRTRILRAALSEAGVEVLEIHAEVWSGIEDKSQVTGLRSRLKFLLAWLGSYPRLVLRYIQAPKHDAVIVGYLGHLDVLVLWPFARLKGKPIVWDAFLSLYDTVVVDRKLVGPKHPLAWLLWAWEWLACRVSTRVVLDTAAHAELFSELYKLQKGRTSATLVGAEADVFPGDRVAHAAAENKSPATADETTILFYGQFIPLHGIETIVKAAQIALDRPYRWVLIGRGQEETRIRALIDEGPKMNLEWVPWVPYAELNKWICQSDLCLGIFGDTGKASRVIPNKVFQILAAGQPLITRDSPAIRELLSDSLPGVYLVPPADPEALLDAVERFRTDRPAIAAAGGHLHSAARERFSLPALGASWLSILHETIGRPVVAHSGGR
jgi:glycosyltransferase involved in cell wall biosynthesis